MRTLFLSNMTKSRKLTSTFFPIDITKNISVNFSALMFLSLSLTLLSPSNSVPVISLMEVTLNQTDQMAIFNRPWIINCLVYWLTIYKRRLFPILSCGRIDFFSTSGREHSRIVIFYVTMLVIWHVWLKVNNIRDKIILEHTNKTFTWLHFKHGAENVRIGYDLLCHTSRWWTTKSRRDRQSGK